jgi:hypothetical protein
MDNTYRKLEEAYRIMESMRIYRGINVGNRNGHYWSLDREYARQFTQSGLDKEIMSKEIGESSILVMNPLPSANSEEEMSMGIQKAIEGGYKGVMASEGKGQPNSIYII